MGYKLKRIMMWVNNTTRGLPAEYQEVEYIEGSGNDTTGTYIDTGFKPNNNTKYVVDFLSVGQAASPIGCYNNPSGWGLVINTNSGTYDIGIHYGTKYELTSITCGKRVRITLDGNKVYEGDTLKYTFSAQTFQMNINAWLFCWNKNGTQSNNFGTRIRSAKIYDDGTIVRDFVPCYRKADDVIGLYDLVNDQFYTNSGTGTFTKGNDVTDMVEKQVRPSEWQPGANTLFYYEFENNLNDSGGKGNSATGSGIGYDILDGQYVIKNTDNYANLSCPDVGTLGTGDFTFSVRMYPPNVSSLSSSNYYTIFGYINNSAPITGPNIWYWGSEQKIAFRIVEGDVKFGPTWSSLDGRWNHIVFTRKDGVCSGYVNNVLVAQWTDGLNLPQTVKRNVGYRGDYSPRPQTIKYDKAIFENVGWAATEVSNYYNQTKGNYGL